MEAILKTRIINTEKNIWDFYQIVKNQYKQMIQFLKSQDLVGLQKLVKHEKFVHSHYNAFFKRNLYDLAQFSFFGSYLRKILGYLYIANELERVAGYLYDTCQELTNDNLLPDHEKILFAFWDQLFCHFEKVEKLFFNKSIEVLLEFLRVQKKEKVTFLTLLEKLNLSTSKVDALLLKQVFLLSDQFKNIERCFGSLTKIVEFLLLIQSFPEFWRYKKSLYKV